MFQKFVNTWEGIAMAIAGAIGATIALAQAVPPLLKILRKLTEGAATLLEVKETFERLEVKMETGFKAVQDGQLNVINARRFLLDADEVNAHFETDGQGKTEWVSRKWRKITGLDNSEAHGSGWENGLAPENEQTVIRAWQAAIDNQRTFELVIVYIDRDGKRTPMKVLASPMRDSLGNVVQFHGICTPIPS